MGMIRCVSYQILSIFCMNMPMLRSIMSKVFARTAGFALRSSGWKRSTVYANLRHVYGTSYSKFYGTLICNLAHHAGELLFRFPTFKKLPREVSAYPCRIEGWNFALAEGSAPVLEKMRNGGIFLTAHFGNYEAIGPWLCRLGIPLVASYIPVRPAWLNRILDKRIRAVDGRPYGVDARTPREFLRLLDDSGTAPRHLCISAGWRMTADSLKRTAPASRKQLTSSMRLNCRAHPTPAIKHPTPAMKIHCRAISCPPTTPGSNPA